MPIGGKKSNIVLHPTRWPAMYATFFLPSFLEELCSSCSIIFLFWSSRSRAPLVQLASYSAVVVITITRVLFFATSLLLPPMGIHCHSLTPNGSELTGILTRYLPHSKLTCITILTAAAVCCSLLKGRPPPTPQPERRGTTNTGVGRAFPTFGLAAPPPSPLLFVRSLPSLSVCGYL